MPYNTSNNTNYGGPEGNNKYTALANLQVGPAQNAETTALSDGRVNLLAGANVFPGNLELAVPNWDAIVTTELGGGAPKLPPLVVISSNRATFIAAGIQTVNQQLAALGIANFNNVADRRPLSGVQPASPPLYSPARLGPNPQRSVYVVVHFAEYDTYKAALAAQGITVVGWQFQPPPGGIVASLSGFGASRYAAIEFCKHLRSRAIAHGAGGNPMWDKAWLLDDNVVGIADFPGFAAVEGALAANQVCAGFKGLAVPRTRAQNQNWAQTGPVAQREGTALPALPGSTAPQLVQQVALWNIDYLTAQNANFSPIFVASKEDLSFTSYFDTAPIAYNWYALDIYKEIVPGNLYDDDGGSDTVNLARASYVAYFAALEGRTQMVPTQAQGGAQVLRKYVTSVVLPQSRYLSQQAFDAGAQNLAVCQSVEQIVTRAIKGSFPTAPVVRYLNAGAADRVFRLGVAQAVTRRDVP